RGGDVPAVSGGGRVDGTGGPLRGVGRTSGEPHPAPMTEAAQRPGAWRLRVTSPGRGTAREAGTRHGRLTLLSSVFQPAPGPRRQERPALRHPRRDKRA